ncbi:MAG: WG repeat-containing protein [Ruminococcus sp.]
MKDAKYAVALGFYDNVAFVCDDKSGEYYLINKNFEPISDKKYDDASYFTNGTAQVMDDTGIYSINSKEEKTDCNFWGEFTQPDNGTGPYGNILGGIIDGVTYISYSEDKIGAFSQSENFAAYYDKNNAELAHFDGYSSCTNFSNGYAFLNGSTVINSNFEIIGNAEYFVSGEGSTFYSELWSSTYSDTHVYDGGYFIGSNDFETDLTQKYKVIKIALELYEEKSQ